VSEIIDQGAFNEAQDIVRNTENPAHKLYHNNDKATVDRVMELFRRADPTEVDLADKLPPALRGLAPAKAGDPAGPEPATPPSDVEISLKNEWGSSFDANLGHAVDALGDIFGSADDFQKFLDTENITPAEQIKAVKWLSAIGKKKQR